MSIVFLGGYHFREKQYLTPIFFKLKNEIDSTDIFGIVRGLGFLVPHYLENVCFRPCAGRVRGWEGF
jgi:hypothetical protein